MAMALSSTKAAVAAIAMTMMIVPSLSIAYTKLPLPAQALGPEALAFNAFNEGPFTGVVDGRILKYQRSAGVFLDYAFDSPNRSKAVCDGNTNPSAFGGICGRPLGLEFLYRTGELYVADAHFGLLVVSTNGRLAKQVVSGAEGQPFKFLNGLANDQLRRIVYTTDASARYNVSEFMALMPTSDSTGRLIKYDINTNVTTVLLRNLSFPAGVAVSSGGDYVLVTESLGNRILKYWVNGPRINNTEVILKVLKPDNIKRTPLGDYYWVAAAQQTPNGQTVPIALKIDSAGRVLANISLAKEYNTTLISEVQENNRALYIGSLYTPFVGKYSLF